MDVILDCVFDQVFAHMDRGCLLARYKRRQFTDYLSTVIKGSSAMDTEAGCRQAVLAAMRFHSSSKESNSQICLLGKYHNVLYVAATLCFDWRLQDSDVVMELLLDIFNCECTFERLFVGAILGTKVSHLISGWKSDFRSREECMEAVKYFADHATKAELWFDCAGGIRKFVDVPMESYGRSTPLKLAAQAGQPDVMTLLLHFGALVTPDPEDPSTCALQPLLRRINDICHDRPGESIPLEFISCLNLLVRELPRLPPILPDPRDDSQDPQEEVRELHPRVLTMVPPDKTGLAVPCLRKLCRIVARQELASRCLLPHGLSNLLLPDSLIQFLSNVTD